MTNPPGSNYGMNGVATDEVPPIEVKSLEMRYGNQLAVDQLTFSVSKGSVHGLIGPNGAGKTTTLECLLGLRIPDRGRALVFGRDPHKDRLHVFQDVGAYLQEDAGLYRRLRVSEAFRLYAAFYDAPESPTAVAERFGIADRPDATYGSLSGGQKARLHMALATIGRPRLLVLDEPTAGLDPGGRREVWELIRDATSSRDLTVLVSTHHLDEAQRYCDSVSMLHRGQLVLDGDARALLSQHRFGTHVEVARAELPSELQLSATWVSRRRDVSEFVFDDDSALADIYDWASQAPSERQINVRPASLDDLFLSLTERVP